MGLKYFFPCHEVNGNHGLRFMSTVSLPVRNKARNWFFPSRRHWKGTRDGFLLQKSAWCQLPPGISYSPSRTFAIGSRPRLVVCNSGRRPQSRGLLASAQKPNTFLAHISIAETSLYNSPSASDQAVPGTRKGLGRPPCSRITHRQLPQHLPLSLQ